MKLDKAHKQIESLRDELHRERNGMQVSSHEIEGQKGRISELHLRNQILQNEIAEQRAVTKL